MINLMPPEQKKSIRFGSYNVSVIQYIVLIVISGIALAGVIAFGVQIVKSDEAKLEASISAKSAQLVEYSGSIEEAKLLAEKIDTVDVLLRNEVKYSTLLQEIAGLLPPGSAIRNISFKTDDIGENFTLQVFLVNEKTATELQQNLANSELFTGADIQSLAGLEQVADGYGWSTTIIVSFDLDKLGEQQ